MQFSKNNLLMTDHFFLKDNDSTENVWFLICLFKLTSSPYHK